MTKREESGIPGCLVQGQELSFTPRHLPAKVKKVTILTKVKELGLYAACSEPGITTLGNPGPGPPSGIKDVLRRAVDLRGRIGLPGFPGLPDPLFPLKSSSGKPRGCPGPGCPQVYYSAGKTGF